MHSRWQYPDVTAPVTTPAPVAVPDSGWMGQLPDPVRRPPGAPRPEPSLVILVEPAEPTFVLGQLLDPQRPPLRSTPTQPTFVFVDILHRTFAIAWLRQQLDPLLPLEQPLHTEPHLTFVDVLHRPFELSWLPLFPDPQPKPPTTYTEPVIVFVDELHRPFGMSWLRQQLDPMLSLAPRPATEPIIVFVDILHRPFAIGWLGQGPDPVRPPTPPTHTEPDLVFEDSLHRRFDLSWWRQGLDPTWPEARLEPGAVARPLVEEVPDTSWLRQAEGPVRAPVRLIVPQPTLTEPSLFPVTWGWLLQHPEPLQAILRRHVDQPQVFRVVTPVVLDWLRQQLDPVRLQLRTLAPQPEFRWDESLYPLLLDKWWMQEFNPTLPRPPRQHMLVLVVIPPPFVPTPFAFNECLALWQIIFPDSWESAAAASGLIESVAAVDPSGYRSARWISTPSGYVVAVEVVLPSGYVSPSVILPTPSGILTWDQICNAAAEGASSGYMSALWTPPGSGYTKQPPTQTDRGPKSPLWDF